MPSYSSGFFLSFSHWWQHGGGLFHLFSKKIELTRELSSLFTPLVQVHCGHRENWVTIQPGCGGNDQTERDRKGGCTNDGRQRRQIGEKKYAGASTGS